MSVDKKKSTSLIVITEENIFDILYLFPLLIDISFVADRLNPQSQIVIKQAVNAKAKFTKPYFSGPRTRTK